MRLPHGLEDSPNPMLAHHCLRERPDTEVKPWPPHDAQRAANVSRMKRACSFLPAATQMIHDLGLEAHLHGVTFECRSDQPKIVRSRLEGRTLSSAEIDREVRETEAAGETLYYLDHELLRRAAPDVVFTQHVCNVCQIGTSYVERAVANLPTVPELVPLVPKCLRDVEGNLREIARVLERPDAAEKLINACHKRLDDVAARLRAARTPRRSVSFIEWIDPLFHCGHWIPDQLALAGGDDAMACPAAHSRQGDWAGLRAYDPEVIVVAPCGFDVSRARQEAAVLTKREGFSQMRAARSGQVYAVDADLFTQPSLSTLVEGVELLAHLFHPTVCPPPAALGSQCAALT